MIHRVIKKTEGKMAGRGVLYGGEASSRYLGLDLRADVLSACENAACFGIENTSLTDFGCCNQA